MLWIAALVLRGLRGAISVAVIVLFSYMVFAVLAQVVGRYVFNYPIAGAEETATMAQIWMVLLGAGYAMRKGLHVGIDLVVTFLPPLLVRVLNAVVLCLALWFLWVVFQGSFRLLQIGQMQSSPALRIPMVYVYLVIPVGALYFALELVVTILPKILGRPEAAGSAASHTEDHVL